MKSFDWEGPCVSKPSKLFVAFYVLAFLVLFVFPYVFTTARWSGHSDFQATFVVSDAETGHSLPLTKIEFKPEDGCFCAEDRIKDKKNFTLKADANGRIAKKWTDCMIGGSSGMFEDTFGVAYPSVSFRASAPGYASSDWLVFEHRRDDKTLKRGKGLATLEVRIALRKMKSKPER